MLRRRNVKVTRLVNGKQAVWRPLSHFKLNKEKCLERDGHRCTICGKETRLHVHHVISRSNGGTEALDNLVTLCAGCHSTITHQGDSDKIIDRCIYRAIKETHRQIEAAFDPLKG